MNLIYCLDLFGTLVFAISGVLVAVEKKFDLVGAMIIGIVTAVGGGTLRDVLIGETPVGWMKDLNYLYVIFAAIPLCFFFQKSIQKLRRGIFLFDTIGIGPNRDFSISELSDASRRGLQTAIKEGKKIVDAAAQRPMPSKDGWIILDYAGRYGDLFMERAAVVRGGYANLPEESIYPARIYDENNELLTGNRRYQLHFSQDQLPQVNAFWSLSAYQLNDSRSLAANEINRYKIGDRTQGLKYNTDGSLTLTIQHERPGDIANWLPVPEGLFMLVLRMYEPGPDMMAGKQELPTIETQK